VAFFSPLPVTVPRIAYSVIHQRQESVQEEDYVKTLFDLTRQAAARASEASQRVRAWRSSQLKEATRGASVAEVGKVSALLEEICPVPAVEEALELATVDAPLPEGRLQRLASAGREYLGSLGFKALDGGPPVHESILLFTGSWNYDFIEHVVRDVMGIYEYPHERHIQELAKVIFFTQNQVATLGDPMGNGPGEWQPTIFFAKGKPMYDEFRSELGRAMERARKSAGLKGISLWQRKLGMGQIFEWELRLRCQADAEQLSRALEAIAEEGGAVAERVAARGRLLIHKRID
jgi:hypothetical protein